MTASTIIPIAIASATVVAVDAPFPSSPPTLPDWRFAPQLLLCVKRMFFLLFRRLSRSSSDAGRTQLRERLCRNLVPSASTSPHEHCFAATFAIRKHIVQEQCKLQVSSSQWNINWNWERGRGGEKCECNTYTMLDSAMGLGRQIRGSKTLCLMFYFLFKNLLHRPWKYEKIRMLPDRKYRFV